MNVTKDAGLADPKCKLYMLFYYIGPAMMSFTFCGNKRQNNDNENDNYDLKDSKITLSKILKVTLIAVVDIIAQTLNYSGSILAGPTLFAIIYSSVTVWTAVYSVILLRRPMNALQWIGVVTVFGGLTVTGFHSRAFGAEVFHGSLLIIVGSSLHAGQYVLSEMVMTTRRPKNGSTTSGDKDATTDERVSPRLNCAIQGIVATAAYSLWQIIYTLPRFSTAIATPAHNAGTTLVSGLGLLFSLALSNLIHAMTFFYTLQQFPGGATSAGVMKGLQAVLVFVASAWVFCGRSGGKEMCMTKDKVFSLLVVLSGVLIFGKATEMQHLKDVRLGAGYEKIEEVDDGV